MDQNKFQNTLAHAQQLMLSETFNRKVEGFARQRNGKGGGNNDLSEFEAAAGFGGGNSGYEQIPMVQTKRTNNSNIPSAIRESFEQMPAMSGEETMTSLPRSFTQQLENYQPINEQRQYMSQPSNSVDYSLIKTIVQECLRQQEQKILSEGTIRGFRMGKGNKIQVVDSKGNLYEGILTLKKKAQG